MRVEVTNGAARVTANGVPISMSDEFVRRTGHIGFKVTRGSIEVRRAHRRAARHISRLFRSRSGRRKRTISTDNQPARAHRGQAGLLCGSDEENVKEGMVTMDAVVLPDGTVGAIKVTKSLDLDLDQAAAAAACRRQFYPGIKDGEPVPVVIVVEMSFTLK